MAGGNPLTSQSILITAWLAARRPGCCSTEFGRWLYNAKPLGMARKGAL
jgi:hypothetical protein